MSFALQKIPSKWTNWITYPPVIPYLGTKLISKSTYFISLQATKGKNELTTIKVAIQVKRTAVTYRLFHCKSKTVKSYKFWQKWWCMWRTFTAYRTHIMTCVQECVLYTIISYSQERILFWALSGALMPPATYHPNQITVQTRHIEIEPSAVYASIYLNSVYPAGAHNMPCLNPKAVSI